MSDQSPRLIPFFLFRSLCPLSSYILSFLSISLTLCFFLSTLRTSLSSAFAFSLLPSFLPILAFSSSFPSSLPPVSPSLLLFFFSSTLHFSFFSVFFNPPLFYYPSPFSCRFLFRPPSPVCLSFPQLFSLFSFPSIYSVPLFPYSWILFIISLFPFYPLSIYLLNFSGYVSSLFTFSSFIHSLAYLFALSRPSMQVLNYSVSAVPYLSSPQFASASASIPDHIYTSTLMIFFSF